MKNKIFLLKSGTGYLVSGCYISSCDIYIYLWTPQIKEVPYDEHIVRGRYGRKELKANTRYVTEDGYKYTTDEFGRIVDVEADNLVLKQGTRNLGMQRQAGREDRYPDDDVGHLIGSQFNGPGDIENLVAQNSQLNRASGEWYQMEQQWANALKEVPPKQVSVQIQSRYSSNSLRPDSFIVEYEIEGRLPVLREIAQQINEMIPIEWEKFILKEK